MKIRKVLFIGLAASLCLGAVASQPAKKTKKKHTKDGIISSILALASFLLFAGACICSMVLRGKGGLYLGAMGILAMGLSIYGFLLGLKSFSEENRNFLYSKTGSVANGILTVIWLTMFLIGIG